MIVSEHKNSVNNSSIVLYSIFFIVIFISDDTFNFGTNGDFTYFIFKYLVYFFLTLYLLMNSNLRFLTVLTKSSLVFYMVVLSVLLTAFFNFDLSGGYVYQIWLFLLGFLIVNFFTPKQFVDVYIKYIYFLSVVSLIVFVIANISTDVFSIFPVQTNTADAIVYNLGVCMVSANHENIRNMGIFREPGVYMIYLNLAIIFELFFKSEINKRNVFVFIITIFTTLSTAAFIALGTIFIAFLFTKSKTRASVKSKRFIIAMALIALGVVVLSGELYSMVFDKIGKDNIADGSSLARGISVLANFNIFLDNFIFGVGIKDYPGSFGKYTLELTGFFMDVGNNTNTITTVLAVYGIFLGCFFIYMLISFAKKASNSILVRNLIFLVLIMFYSNEDLRYSLLSAMMLMWGLTSRKEIDV